MVVIVVVVVVVGVVVGVVGVVVVVVGAVVVLPLLLVQALGTGLEKCGTTTISGATKQNKNTVRTPQTAAAAACLRKLHICQCISYDTWSETFRTEVQNLSVQSLVSRVRRFYKKSTLLAGGEPYVAHLFSRRRRYNKN